MTGQKSFVNTFGDRLKGRQVNWKVLPCHANLRNFPCSFAIATDKEASFGSTMLNQSPGWSTWLSILKQSFSRKRFRGFKLKMGQYTLCAIIVRKTWLTNWPTRGKISSTALF